MTTPQSQALEQIKRLMREHFDAALFVYEVENPNSTTEWELEYTGVGSHAASLGLASYAEHTMLNPDIEEED